MTARIVSYKDSIIKKLRDAEARAIASATNRVFEVQLMNLQKGGEPSRPGEYPTRQTGVGAAGLTKVLKRRRGRIGYTQDAFYMSILSSKFGKRLGLVKTMLAQWEVLQVLVIDELRRL